MKSYIPAVRAMATPRKMLVVLWIAVVALILCVYYLDYDLTELTFDPRPLLSDDNVTCVTALYDIKRHDRSFENYKKWTIATLQIPLPMVIYCNSRDAKWIRKARGNLPILIIEEEHIPLENMVGRISEILPKMRHGRGDVEWVNNRYIATQYSKAIWINRTIKDNPFHTKRFFWVDAGMSRFFTRGQPNAPFPLLQNSGIEPDKLYITDTGYLYQLDFIPKFMIIGSQKAYLMGTVFGGYAAPVHRICNALLDVLQNDMIGKDRIDNEQIGLAWIYLKHRDWFHPLSWKTGHCVTACI
jgi:hypothetical protein